MAAREARANQQSEECSSNIQEHITNGRRTRFEERLVKFVARGKQRATQQNCAKNHQRFCAERWKAAKCSPKKKSQNRIFDNVRGFAYNDENCPNRLRRHTRLQPEQEGNNVSRRVLGGHDAGRTNEYYADPNQQRQPVFEKRFHLEIECLKLVISTETPNIQHPTLNVQWRRDWATQS